MSFRFSSGTLDSMAGIYAPPKRYRLGSAGGKGGKAKAGGTMLALAVASMMPRPAQASSGHRQGFQAKHAFGGGTHGAMSGRALATMARTARRTPEVMVRVTGRQHGGGHVLANFTYISRLGHGADKQMALYSSDGDVLTDGRDMQVLAQDWQEWEMGGDARRKGATSISMILSMPSGTDPEKLREAALDFAREEFANRSWVASLHVDRDHPHVHLTFARRDHDGRRFHPDRDDLFRYRQRFAEKLRDRGIEANATPARARGIDPKHEPITARKVRAKGEVPRIDKRRAERSRRLAELGVTDPVKAVLANQQATVRSAYAQSIAELSASPSFVDQAIAKSLERFVASMAPPEPSSMRTVSADAGERAADPQRGLRLTPREDIFPSGDPVAAAIERAMAMTDRINARKAEERSAGAEPHTANREEAQAASERLRSLLEAARQPAPKPMTDRAEDIRRRTEEYDREQRERDRSRDKDGPGR